MSHNIRGSKAGARFRSRVTPMLSKMGTRILQEKFFKAIFTRNIPEIARCLEKKVNPNVWNKDYGVTALHILAQRNDCIVGYRLMICENIKVDARDTHGYTPLHTACSCGSKKFAILLLQNGANPNVTDRFGKTPLHVSVLNENFGIVTRLINYGATVNILDCFQNTPLAISILDVKNLLIAKTLIQNGADLRFEEERPLHLFFETILHCHTIKQIDFVVLLLDNELDINTREKNSGRICLHFVALTGYLDLAVLLVERGADLKAVDKNDRTPAKAAADHGNRVICDYFRKGYRPPSLLKSLPLLYLWSNKVKARIAQKQAEQELADDKNEK